MVITGENNEVYICASTVGRSNWLCEARRQLEKVDEWISQ